MSFQDIDERSLILFDRMSWNNSAGKQIKIINEIRSGVNCVSKALGERVLASEQIREIAYLLGFEDKESGELPPMGVGHSTYKSKIRPLLDEKINVSYLNIDFPGNRNPEVYRKSRVAVALEKLDDDFLLVYSKLRYEQALSII